MTEIFNNLKVISIDTNNLKKCDNEDCDENSFIAGNWCSVNCCLIIELNSDSFVITIDRKGFNSFYLMNFVF